MVRFQIIIITCNFFFPVKFWNTNNCALINFRLKIAVKNGDLQRLLVPTDSKGRKCGIDNAVIDKPFLLFFNLEKCIDARVPLFGCSTPQVCVEQCPTKAFLHNEYGCNENNFNQIRADLICQMGVSKSDIRSCPDINNSIIREDCARWYLPSQSRKYSGCFLYLMSLFLFIYFGLFICSLFFCSKFILYLGCVKINVIILYYYVPHALSFAFYFKLFNDLGLE